MDLQLADLWMLLVFVVAGAAALLVVVSKNVVHSALYLVVALLGVAGVFLLLGAEFLAWTQVLVYAGAVIVLILFGLMLTRAPIGPIREDTENARLAFGVSAAIFVFLMIVIISSFNDTRLVLAPTLTIDLASFLYVDWAFPLLALGFLLTVALVGAVIIARGEVGEGPEPEDDDYWDRSEVPPARQGDSTAEPGPAQNQPSSPVGISGKAGS